MTELSASDQALIYSLALYVPVMLFIVWEAISPRRELSTSTWIRWLNNAALWWLDLTVVRWVAAGALASATALTESGQWGLLNHLALPQPVETVAPVLLLDFGFYVRHVLFHQVSWLWRFHVMHHSDLECDVTTCVRFHPADYLIDVAISALIVLAIGGPPLAVLVYIVAATATNAFRHANVNLPRRAERVLGLVLVTPSFHRVHHSALRRETDSNFGVVFPWWDRLFNTCIEKTDDEQHAMTIGLEYFREPRENRLDRLLTQPLRRPRTATATEVKSLEDLQETRSS